MKEDTYIFIYCSRRSDSRARRSVGSELNCTPVPETGVGGGGGGPPPALGVEVRSVEESESNPTENLASFSRKEQKELLTRVCLEFV